MLPEERKDGVSSAIPQSRNSNTSSIGNISVSTPTHHTHIHPSSHSHHSSSFIGTCFPYYLSVKVNGRPSPLQDAYTAALKAAQAVYQEEVNREKEKQAEQQQQQQHQHQKEHEGEVSKQEDVEQQQAREEAERNSIAIPPSSLSSPSPSLLSSFMEKEKENDKSESRIDIADDKADQHEDKENQQPTTKLTPTTGTNVNTITSPSPSSPSSTPSSSHLPPPHSPSPATLIASAVLSAAPPSIMLPPVLTSLDKNLLHEAEQELHKSDELHKAEKVEGGGDGEGRGKNEEQQAHHMRVKSRQVFDSVDPSIPSAPPADDLPTVKETNGAKRMRFTGSDTTDSEVESHSSSTTQHDLDYESSSFGPHPFSPSSRSASSFSSATATSSTPSSRSISPSEADESGSSGTSSAPSSTSSSVSSTPTPMISILTPKSSSSSMTTGSSASSSFPSSSHLPPPLHTNGSYGQDSYFICSDDSSVQMFGVADGVGGWRNCGVDSGIISRALMTKAMEIIMEEVEKMKGGHKRLEEGSGELQPQNILERAYYAVKQEGKVEAGSTTACILSLSTRPPPVSSTSFSAFRLPQQRAFSPTALNPGLEFTSIMEDQHPVNPFTNEPELEFASSSTSAPIPIAPTAAYAPAPSVPEPSNMAIDSEEDPLASLIATAPLAPVPGSISYARRGTTLATLPMTPKGSSSFSSSSASSVPASGSSAALSSGSVVDGITPTLPFSNANEMSLEEVALQAAQSIQAQILEPTSTHEEVNVEANQNDGENMRTSPVPPSPSQPETQTDSQDDNQSPSLPSTSTSASTTPTPSAPLPPLYLSASNLGDSGFVVIRSGRVVHRSEFQRSGRIVKQLAIIPPRFAGPDSRYCNDPPEEASRSVFQCELDDIIITGTDGWIDNMIEPLEVNDFFGFWFVEREKEEDQRKWWKNFEDKCEQLVQLAHTRLERELQQEQKDTSDSSDSIRSSRLVSHISDLFVSESSSFMNHVSGKPDDLTLIVAQIQSLNHTNQLHISTGQATMEQTM